MLSCIYPVFTESYWSTEGPAVIRDKLCDTTIRLAGKQCTLLLNKLEAHALTVLDVTA
nr:DUF6596 domain-containing protein [Mycobacterium uberis]